MTKALCLYPSYSPSLLVYRRCLYCPTADSSQASCFVENSPSIGRHCFSKTVASTFRYHTHEEPIFGPTDLDISVTRAFNTL